ncbi:cysteine desulfurase [Vagococcus silagei]|uniref:Cysteine desulfurase n=1 Tax=Vagococcus silagei TaxID=2508885 RepID=A0A4V3TV62_9ENTE|nr:cysteine desulfurase [Vagococcus silagei]THB61599.1 cysteine desulfurase [Vagococcus silagei]
MSFFDTTTVEGCPVKYKVGSNARGYSFKDYGFKETASGNFQLARPLDLNPQMKQSPKLKITIAKDLKTLKMSITTANGMKALNIFKGDNQTEKQEQFYFLMDDLIKENCLEKAE